MTRVFFDTSVFLASLRSPEGGSSEVLRYAVAEAIESFLSHDVLDEVARHVHEVQPALRSLLLDYLATIPFTSVTVTAEEVEAATLFTDSKDSAIVAAAVKAEVDYLVTLDQRHLLNKRSEIEPYVRFKIISPGDLLSIVRR